MTVLGMGSRNSMTRLLQLIIVLANDPHMRVSIHHWPHMSRGLHSGLVSLSMPVQGPDMRVLGA